MEKSNNKKEEVVISKCPYSTSQSTGKTKMVQIVKKYELEYNDVHEVVKVDKGDIDLIKDVQSHAGEVGLDNVMKKVVALGQNPMSVFKKSEDGVLVAVDPNATVEDIIHLEENNKTKLDELAKSLGVDVKTLIKAMNDGTVEGLVKASFDNKEKKPDKEKEGGAD